MKKIFIGLLAMVLVFSIMPVLGQAKLVKSSDYENFTKAFEEVQEALQNIQIEIDLENQNIVEKSAYNDKGEKIGELGIEKIDTEIVYALPKEGEFSALGTTTLTKGVNHTFKVYWNAITVNYHFYVTVYVDKSTGLGRIVRAYDEWYLVVPPGIVSSDTLSIIRKYETSSYAAEARYTLALSAPVSTKAWIYGKVKDGKFITGGN